MHTYNKRRLLTGETSAQAGYVYTLGYAYDANGFLANLTYPDTQVISYAPDALGRATKVAAGTTNYAKTITYFPNGAIKGFTYGNNVVHTMTQNARLLPARSLDKKGTAAAVLDDNYVFDANGNVDAITDGSVALTHANNRGRDMGYDGLDRLLVADAPKQWGTASYTYDALDNLVSADQGTRQYRYSYDASNRLTQIKTPAGANIFTFGYDVYGNVTNKGAQTYAFDIANRLSAVTGLQTYRYDGQGRRVQTTDADNKVELWVYSQSGQVLYTSEARRSQNLTYLYLGNTQIATRTVAWGTGTVTMKYQHTDALGSPVIETNSSTGAIVKRNLYAPYGEAYAPTVIDGTGYTGHVMDQATGLINAQQRYLDPQIGRFLSVDPAASEFNRYDYAANNPYRFTDPDGREAGGGYATGQYTMSGPSVEGKEAADLFFAGAAVLYTGPIADGVVAIGGRALTRFAELRSAARIERVAKAADGSLKEAVKEINGGKLSQRESLKVLGQVVSTTNRTLAEVPAGGGSIVAVGKTAIGENVGVPAAMVAKDGTTTLGVATVNAERGAKVGEIAYKFIKFTPNK